MKSVTNSRGGGNIDQNYSLLMTKKNYKKKAVFAFQGAVSTLWLELPLGKANTAVICDQHKHG